MSSINVSTEGELEAAKSGDLLRIQLLFFVFNEKI